jgi:tripartite-type tricarboxylate transporter receptor subunit TctC
MKGRIREETMQLSCRSAFADRRMGKMLFIFALSVAAALFPSASQAQDPANFYRGRTMQLVVAFGSGGGYDLYARLLARFITRHIPGTPTIVVQNMPGAGGRVAANWLYTVAPRDGSVFGTIDQSAALDQAMKMPGVQFDAANFNWIGNPIVDNLVTIVAADTGLRTLDDLKKAKPLFCGDVGGGPTTTFPQTINRLLKAEHKIVAGYQSVAAIHLAMERGEVNCIGGTTWSSLKVQRGQQLKEGKILPLLQWGLEADEDISKAAGRPVPLSQELAESEADRNAVRFISSTAAIGRPFVAPPNVPADRIEVLREAFDRMIKDPEFIAAAAQAQMAIHPLSGRELQKLVAETARAPEDIVRRAMTLVGGAH